MSMIEEAAQLPEAPVLATEDVPPQWRRVSVKITASFLHQLLVSGPALYRWRCVEGIPRDAMIVGVYIDGAYADPAIMLVFQHPDFAPVPPTEMMPMIFPSYEATLA